MSTGDGEKESRRNIILYGIRHVTFGACHKSPHSQSRVTASSATSDLACYGYIKRSTVIDKLSLRLGEGGSSVNTLSVTLTPL